MEVEKLICEDDEISNWKKIHFEEECIFQIAELIPNLLSRSLHITFLVHGLAYK